MKHDNYTNQYSEYIADALNSISGYSTYLFKSLDESYTNQYDTLNSFSEYTTHPIKSFDQSYIYRNVLCLNKCDNERDNKTLYEQYYKTYISRIFSDNSVYNNLMIKKKLFNDNERVLYNYVYQLNTPNINELVSYIYENFNNRLYKVVSVKIFSNKIIGGLLGKCTSYYTNPIDVIDVTIQDKNAYYIEYHTKIFLIEKKCLNILDYKNIINNFEWLEI